MLARPKIALVALLCLTVLAAGATTETQAAGKPGWVLYSGRERGVRVVFELKGRRLIPAFVSVPVVCGGGGPRHRHRRFEELRDSPIFIDRQGRFHETTERSDSFESETQRIVGRVTPKTIEGTILETYVQPARVGNESCHTGKSRREPAEELKFRANRHRGSGSPEPADASSGELPPSG
jgi:hypothetical protein